MQCNAIGANETSLKQFRIPSTSVGGETEWKKVKLSQRGKQYFLAKRQE